ncbi:MAG TPA: SelT/SelW/SelH family protein [Microlunatus sp.]|nr:SelT/SelW/SelH family protein [Microlunatus sp.]
MDVPAGPQVVITYCTQCRWLLRATWIAQELLSSFTVDIGEVSLRPGTGGVFQVAIDGELIWDRAVDHGFPEIGPLKRIVRDRVAPGRDLGHIDRAAPRPVRREAPDHPEPAGRGESSSHEPTRQPPSA